jgi:hypothetical protein
MIHISKAPYIPISWSCPAQEKENKRGIRSNRIIFFRIEGSPPLEHDYYMPYFKIAIAGADTTVSNCAQSVLQNI